LVLVGIIVNVGYAQKPETPTIYKWRLQSTHAASDATYQYLFPHLAKKLDEFSNGRIKLTYYAGGALVPVQETLNMLGKGVFEMGLSVGAYWQGLMPVAGLEFGFPNAWHSSEETFTVFYERGILELLRRAYAEHNVRYLGAPTADAFCIESMVNFKNLEGLRKLKIRSIGVPTVLLNKLGCKTVQIAWPELYTALKLGTADACTVGIYYWYMAKIPEISKYVMWPPLFNPGTLNLMMNLKVWNELPPDIKQVVDYAVLDSIFYMHRNDRNQTDLMYDRLKNEYKVEFIHLSTEDKNEIAKASRELWKDLAKKDKYSEQFMKIIEDFSKEKGHIK
jgi:TRAP-type mannitol/chloroaromatic compound transport system substrate-binding protein